MTECSCTMPDILSIPGAGTWLGWCLSGQVPCCAGALVVPGRAAAMLCPGRGWRLVVLGHGWPGVRLGWIPAVPVAILL